MASYCKVILVGNVGTEPQLRQPTPTLKVAEFSLAINDPVNKEQPPTWYRISVYNNRADTIMQYVKKGTQLMVEGKLNVREYLDKDQVKRISLEVKADDFLFLGSRSGEGGSGGQSREQSGTGYTMQQAPAHLKAGEDDDLPF